MPYGSKMFKRLEKRFPQWRIKIEQLFHEDRDFRALCEEYEEMAKTLAFWIWLSRLRLPLREIDRQKRDCKEFLQELETEILMILDSSRRHKRRPG